MKKIYYCSKAPTIEKLSIPIIDTLRLYFYLHVGIFENGTLYKVDKISTFFRG